MSKGSGHVGRNLAFLILLVASAACSDGEGSPSASYRRFSLELVDGATALPSATTLAYYAGRDELVQGLAFEGPHEVVEGADSVTVPAGESTRVVIEGPFDGAEFLRLSLTVTGSGKTHFHASALADGEVLGRVSERKFHPRRHPTAVELDFRKLPPAADGTNTVERIHLRLEPQKRPLALHAVTLSSIPPMLRLPRGSLTGNELVYVRGETRRATCLAPGRPLVGRFAAEAGMDLVFSCVVPDEMRVRGCVPQVDLTLSAGGLTEQHAISMKRVAGEPTRWALQRIPLEAFAGREVEARFDLLEGRAGVCALGEPALVRRHPAAPTVLLVTSDTHRADHVAGALGSVDVETPALAALGREGVFFLDAYATTNNTTPSHAALFTGRHPRDTGVLENGQRLAEAAPTLAERFREAGFATLASISSAPVDHRLSGLGQGFDHFFSMDAGGSRDSAQAIGDVLAAVGDYEGVPLFVWVHLFNAHSPYEPPPELAERYYESDLDPRDASREDAAPELAPKWDPSIVDPEYTEALYRGEVTYLDQRLAELFDHPRFRSATIAFTSDHGETLSRGAPPFGHWGISPSNLDVPLILRSPGLTPGTRVERPVRQLDVGRTLLDLAGLEAVEFPGRSLLRELDDSAGSSEPRFALEAYGLAASVHVGRWMCVLKLNLRAEERERAEELRHAVFLYDVSADPYLEHDVLEDNRDIASRLRTRLVEWLAEAEDQGWATRAELRKDDVDAELAALGYTAEQVERSDRWFDPGCECSRCLEW